MKKTSEGGGSGRRGAGVSRRKFLERTVTTGGAALMSATAAYAVAQESKPAPASLQPGSGSRRVAAHAQVFPRTIESLSALNKIIRAGRVR